MKKLQLKDICLLFNLFYFYSEYIKVWNILDYLAGEIGVYFRFTAEAKDPVGFIVPNRTEEEKRTKLTRFYFVCLERSGEVLAGFRAAAMDFV